MQAEPRERMALDEDDLREVDRLLLAYLSDGRVTPVYARERMVDEGHDEVTGAYLGQRLKRLVEHDHVRNLYDTGLYELVTDPRDDD